MELFFIILIGGVVLPVFSIALIVGIVFLIRRPSRDQSLIEENRRLREEVDRLKHQGEETRR